MARRPNCRHDTGELAIDAYKCPVYHRVWCDACSPACQHVREHEPHAFVPSDDAYL